LGGRGKHPDVVFLVKGLVGIMNRQSEKSESDWERLCKQRGKRSPEHQARHILGRDRIWEEEGIECGPKSLI